jgi:phage tail-like protein
MAFSNHDYFYINLPARFRREDKELFLKRFFQFSGETMDEWDEKFDAFFESINPDTASEIWIDFWLQNLFGWSWFPYWFTLANKQQLYGNFAHHLARRGTRRGIELWLLDFGIVARVHTRALPWGECVYGETHFAITEPLHLIIEILFLQSAPQDLHVWGEGVYGEFYYTEPKPLFTEKEILDLIRFVQPHAQEVIVVSRVGEVWKTDEIYWQQISW